MYIDLFRLLVLGLAILGVITCRCVFPAIVQAEEHLARLPRSRVERHLAARPQVSGDSEAASEAGRIQVE